VQRVHDLHVWTLSSGSIALSAHLDLRDLANWPSILAAARDMLAKQHGIEHVTLQPEVLNAAPLVRREWTPHPAAAGHTAPRSQAVPHD